jgi:hypothetical protein
MNKENTEETRTVMTNNNNAIYAVLDILEQMNPYDISRYLKFIYNQYVEYNYDDDRLRVSFSDLSKEKFPKIVLALENLNKEQIVIP